MIFECDIVHVCRRSRLGAWIEMIPSAITFPPMIVAPVWERGLKFLRPTIKRQSIRRSRLGAWIEINDTYNANQFMK